MNILIYLIAAAVIGWVATSLMHDRSNLLLNIVIAVIGAFLAGWFLSPLFGVGTINDAITLPTMLVTLLGAIILIAIVRLNTSKTLKILVSVDKENTNLGEKNYVDHYHYLVRLVAAWLFRWEYQSKFPKNWKLDSYITGHRDHTCHIEFAWGDLVPMLD